MLTDPHPPSPAPDVWRLFARLVLFVIFTGCDQSFEPLESTDRTFSIFGYLDPGREVQWLRVMPTRPLIFTSPEPLGAIVSLENLATRQTVFLEDSVFTFPHNPDIESEGVYVHNYWTRAPIEAGETYRLTASHPEGGSAEATVRIPEPYRVTVALKQRPTLYDELRVSGVPYLAFTEMRTEVWYDGCPYEVYNHRLEIADGSEDPHVVNPFKLIPTHSECSGVVQDRRLWIVGSEDVWPRGAEHSSRALDVTGVPTNLTNAVGFVGGVVIREVPYEECTLLEPTSALHCILRYDGDVATLRGVVTDVPCGRRLSEATLTLEELAPDAGGQRRLRPAASRVTGEYEISALEPGVRHVLRVNHPAPVPGMPQVSLYLQHVDTLPAYGPGEAALYDVGLLRVTPC